MAALPAALVLGACADDPAPPLRDAAAAVDQKLPDSVAAVDRLVGFDAADLAPPPKPADCSGYAKLSGDLTIKLTHGGQQRVAYAHLPKGYDGTKPVGVVLNFHGYGSNATQQALYSGMNGAAYYMGMVAVHPQGKAGPLGTRGWNAGVCCGSNSLAKTDDVGFVAALISRLSAKICIDPKRIHATGMSNGAFLAYRLACELSDRIASIAPVAGVNTISSCKPKRPMPVLHFHGTADLYVAYNGNKLLDWPGAAASVKQLATHNGCNTGTVKEVYKKGEVLCEAYQSCKQQAEARLCKISNGGHTWPGALDLPVPWLGKKTRDIKATDAMLDFFKAHPMP